MDTSTLVKLRIRLSSISPLGRVIIGFILIAGFYAWVLVGSHFMETIRFVSDTAAKQAVTWR